MYLFQPSESSQYECLIHFYNSIIIHGSIKCEKISKILNFKYKRVTLDVVKSEIPEIKGDIKIDINELERIINSI